MTKRKFHVEITFNKTVEVEITDGMMSGDEDIEEVAQEIALMNSHDSRFVIDDDYQIETVREVTAKESAL
jgi:hypothetical protein